MRLLAVLALALLVCVPAVLAAGGASPAAQRLRVRLAHRGAPGHFSFKGRQPARLPTMSAAAGAALPRGRELVGRRTATSRTFETRDGRFVTRIYTAPINYRDGAGHWQPIDDTLVRTAAAGYALRNKADAYSVEMPSALQAAPVRIEKGGAWVAMRLEGGRGQLRAAGASARVSGALPGVGVEYRAQPDTLKETLTLARAGAASTYRYALDLSPGLAARSDASGGVEIVDAAGRVRFSLLAPFAYDSAGHRIDAAHGISLSVSGAGSKLVVSVAIDPAWLRSAARRYPVVIDPSVHAGDTQDCYIKSGAAAGTSFCGGTSVNVGYDGTNSNRALLQFNVQGAIPANSIVTGANMAVYLNSETNSANQAQLSTYQVTRAWTTAATWNTYNGMSSWTTAGGDFQSTPAYSQTPGTSTGVWNSWAMTPLTQAWLDGTTANDGVILKATTENVNNVYIYAAAAGGTTDAPYLQVDYEPKYLGIQSWYPMFTQRLTDHSSLGVNTANGNLVVSSTDLRIAGTGIPLSVQRTYNNLSGDLDSWGYGWSINSAYDMWLDVYGDGVTYYDPTYTPFHFSKAGTDASGNQLFTAPPGIDASLIQHASDSTYTLTYNKSGAKVSFAADGDDLSSFQDRNGNKIAVNLNATDPDMVASMVDPQNRTTTFGYHTGPSNPCINQVTDSSGRSETYTFYPDSSWSCGLLKTYTDGAGKTTTYNYDSSDDLTGITDPAGDVTQMTYDSSYRVTSIKRITNNSTGAGDTTTFTYNSGNTAVTDARGQKTTYYYDSQGRTTKVVDADGNTQSATYSGDNHIQQFTTGVNQSSGKVLQNTFDSNSNLTQRQAPGNGSTAGATTSWSYNLSGPHPYLPDSMTNPAGHSIGFSFDSNDNLQSATGNGGAASLVNYTYDPSHAGRITSSKDGNNNVTSYSYDANGNLTQISPPAQAQPGSPMGVTRLGYDGLSRVTSVTDGLNQVTRYTYDGVDRVTRIDFADGSYLTFSYDGDGNVTQRYDSSGGTSNYTYDLKSRLTQEADPWGTTNYTYDTADNMSSLADAGGTVTYQYESANLLCWIYLGSSSSSCASPPSGATTFSYNADHKRTATNYPGGVTMAQTWDNDDRLKEIKSTRGATTLNDFQYGYTDSTGKDNNDRTSVLDSSNNLTSYTYDGVDRLTEALTKASGGSGAQVSDYKYAYDGNSNLQTRTVNGAVTTYAYGQDNQLCWHVSGASSNTCGSAPSGAASYSYDTNGNETNDGKSGGGSVSYNARQQTTSIFGIARSYVGADQLLMTQDGVSSFEYNVLGQSERNYNGIYYYTRDADGQLVNERASGGTYNYLLDGLGSAVGLTDSSGNLVDSYQYDPLGNVVSSTENVYNPWKFDSGLFSPSTGYYKFGDRFYDPTTGRWSQPEPLDRGGIRYGNDYLFVADNPTNLVDLSGFDFLDINISVGPVDAGVDIGSGGVDFYSGGGGGTATAGINPRLTGSFSLSGGSVPSNNSNDITGGGCVGEEISACYSASQHGGGEVGIGSGAGAGIYNNHYSRLLSWP